MCYDNLEEFVTAEEIDNELKRFIMDVMLIDPYNFCTLCSSYKKCKGIASPFVCAKKIYDRLTEIDEIPDEEFCQLALTRAVVAAVKSNRNGVTIFQEEQ